MRYLLRLGAGLLIALTSTNLAAQQTACALLTSADIATITGEQVVGQPNPSDMPAQHTIGCMWGVNSRGMVTVMVMPSPTGAARASGLASMRQSLDAMKAQHWAEEKQDFANGSCSTMSPPDTAKDAPIMSQCYAETKGKAVVVNFMSPTKKLTLAQMKGLVDRVVAHLP